MDTTQEQAPTAPRFRVKLLLFALCAVAMLVAWDVCYSTLHTLSRLDVVEAERDRWQRPSDIITALNLSPGETVVDLGSGSGYFALKLSSPVGPEGRVIGEDIRRVPLAFLWIRTVRKGKRNVRVSLGEADDPRLPAKSVNAVLISNTYHEFDNPQTILARVSKALVSGGRLVIVDRAPNPAESGNPTSPSHEISSERVEDDLRRANFQIISRQDHFIASDPGHETWWLLVARNL
jgi:ubiquinone/menaquinone biosynthesis C-methylase UbiE